MKSYLCVGGPLAGQKYDAQGNYFKVPINKPPIASVPIANVPDGPVDIEVIYYIEETFHTAHGSIMFWIPQGQTWFETMTLLLEGYELTNAAITEVSRLKDRMNKPYPPVTKITPKKEK